jgi:glycosyltransferase involved in cell wall biosynthesis
MKISIIIKSLNEEHNIGRAIESSLKAIAEINGDGEVILADSLSIDGTIEVAANYPIKIIQLVNEGDRSCGIGAELGMVVATGEFIYILDADMVFIKGFLSTALEMLEKDSKLAGVAGAVQEMNVGNIEFQERVRRKESQIEVGEMHSLGGGALYRTSALESVKYFTHQGLNSYEEFELGMRLTIKGWKLVRLSLPSVEHYGHQMSSYRLLVRRVKSGYIYGVGELLRSAYSKEHFLYLIKNLKQIKIFVGYLIWLLIVLICLFLVTMGFIAQVYLLLLIVLPFVVMSAKKKNIKVGVYSVFSGLFSAYGLLFGLLNINKTIKSPVSKIKFQWIKK